MKKLIKFIIFFVIGITFKATYAEDEQRIFSALHFKGGTEFKHYVENDLQNSEFEYCGIGLCTMIKSESTLDNINATIAVSYFIMTFFDDDGLKPWLEISPIYFAYQQRKTRDKVLQAWKPQHCKSIKHKQIILCTLDSLIKKYDIRIFHVKYDEGRKNISKIKASSVINEIKLLKHQKKLDSLSI